MDTTAFAWPPALRRLGARLVVALFLAAVCLILGAVPGWTMCFAAWLVGCWLLLVVVQVTTLGLALAAVVRRAWATLRGELRQFAGVALVMLAMLPMGMASTWVELAESRAGLHARAEASARAGGPRLSMTPLSSLESLPDGEVFVYDPDDVLALPPDRRPAAWNSDPVVAAVTGDCRGIRHFVGPYYRWNTDCG